MQSNTFHLPLGDIYYSQDSVARHFQDGRALTDLEEGLRLGTTSIQRVPTITVVDHDGRWFSVDNRRLLVFKRVYTDSTVIPVLVGQHDQEFRRKFTTKNNGEAITVRPRRGKGRGTPNTFEC